MGALNLWGKTPPEESGHYWALRDRKNSKPEIVFIRPSRGDGALATELVEVVGSEYVYDLEDFVLWYKIPIKEPSL